MLFHLHIIKTGSTHKENGQENAENGLEIPTDLHPTGIFGKKSITHLRTSAQETVLNTFPMSHKLYFNFFIFMYTYAVMSKYTDK